MRRAVSKWKYPWWRRLTDSLPWGSLYNCCLQEALEQPSLSAFREARRGSLSWLCLFSVVYKSYRGCGKPQHTISPAHTDGLWIQLASSSSIHPFSKLQSPLARSYLQQEHPKLSDVSAGSTQAQGSKTLSQWKAKWENTSNSPQIPQSSWLLVPVVEPWVLKCENQKFDSPTGLLLDGAIKPEKIDRWHIRGHRF